MTDATNAECGFDSDVVYCLRSPDGEEIGVKVHFPGVAEPETESAFFMLCQHLPHQIAYYLEIVSPEIEGMAERPSDLSIRLGIPIGEGPDGRYRCLVDERVDILSVL